MAVREFADYDQIAGYAAEAVSYTHLDVYKRQISNSSIDVPGVALKGD